MTPIPANIRARVVKATQSDKALNVLPVLCYEGRRLLYATRQAPGGTWRADLQEHWRTCEKCRAYHRYEYEHQATPETQAQRAALDAELAGCSQAQLSGRDSLKD